MAEITSINHHASLTTGFEFLGQGELVKVRTPCKLAKVRVRPGKARRLGDRFLESAKLSAIGGRKPGREVSLSSTRPRVAQAVPTLAIAGA